MSLNTVKVVAFCCNWCSYAGADLAGTSRLVYPAQIKVVRVPCSCRVDATFVLRAFARGADGVIVCGCHLGDCHYATGNYHTQKRMAELFSLLEFMGMEKGRFHLEWISAAEGAKFSETMQSFVAQVENLGKNTRFIVTPPTEAGEENG